MFADQQHGRAGENDNLRAEQSEFAITNDSNAIVFRDCYAFENPTRRSKWLGEDCMFVRNIVRNGQEIYAWQL